MSFRFLILFTFFIQFIAAQSKTRRVYDDNSFTYEFNILLDSKKIEPKEGVKYYWYNYDSIKSTFYGFEGKLLNGYYIKTLLSNGKVLEKGVFDKGIKNGEWKNWFSNGTIEMIQSWRDGYMHGRYEKYLENGVSLEKGKYKNGEKTGKWLYNTKSGRVVKFWSRNKLNGKYLSYNLNKEIIEKGNYKDGLKQGEWINYSGKGNKVINTWNRNVLDGSFYEFRGDSLIKSGRYKKGEKHGIWVDLINKTRFKYKKGKLINKNAETILERIFKEPKTQI